MFGKLNEQAASALLSLEPGDLSYCLKLAKRFEHMGIESIMRATARSLRFPHVKSSC